jgi:hypothetical protein
MAMADYFQRAAIAVSQVLGGYDADAIHERLEGVTVGITYDPSSTAHAEGESLVDLTVRLLARLYPTLRIEGGGDADRWADLARRINPRVEIADSPADVAVGIGPAPAAISERHIFAGSNGWDARVSSSGPLPTGESSNPIGAGLAACLASANIFRQVFTPDAGDDRDLTISGLELESRATRESRALDSAVLGDRTVLVGLGAVGNATVWALSRAPVRGQVWLVDPQTVELSNLQRYVLTELADVGAAKVDIAERFLGDRLKISREAVPWAKFVAERGDAWDRVVVSLDSARDRRAVQASLPRWIANAWTQPGDLGVSVHPWDDVGACLSCLYLPDGEVPSEDRVIASSLGLMGDKEELLVRQLLWANAAPPPDMLNRVSEGLGVPRETLEPYASRPLRDLYVEGVCGGAVLPLSRAGAPAQEVHVPLAHQSALAGVILAGRLLAASLDQTPSSTLVTRLNVLRPVGEYLTQPALKDPRGICICQDEIYREAYALKYDET